MEHLPAAVTTVDDDYHHHHSHYDRHNDDNDNMMAIQHIPEEWLLIAFFFVAIYLIVMACVVSVLYVSDKPPTTTKTNMTTSSSQTSGVDDDNKVAGNASSINELFGVSLAVFILCIFVGVIVILAIVFVVIRIAEQKVVFPQNKTRTYHKISGNWIQLRSGGGLLHCTPNANPRSRPLLFLHGNTGNLDLYEAPLKRCARLGYNIYALEYAGYGMAATTATTNQDIISNGDTVLKDVKEAWNVCGSKDAIVMGFSLGGAILGQTYDGLKPMPAQIVFLNTFHSLSGLVESKLKILGPLITPFLRTQWSTQPPKSFYNEVLIVYTKDDDVVTAEQGKELCSIFQSLDPAVIELPDGGHRYSTIRHLDRWANSENLLPPFINSLDDTR
jgi:hypothetical protein